MNIKEAIENLKIYMKVTNKQIENGELFLDSIVNNEKIQIKSIETLLTAYEKEKKKNKNAKWYLHQEIVRIEEDIEDYLDDDKEGNKQIIGEFKEDLEHWKDVEKLLDGKPKDKLYMDWRKYGEYE